MAGYFKNYILVMFAVVFVVLCFRTKPAATLKPDEAIRQAIYKEAEAAASKVYGLQVKPDKDGYTRVKSFDDSSWNVTVYTTVKEHYDSSEVGKNRCVYVDIKHKDGKWNTTTTVGRHTF